MKVKDFKNKLLKGEIFENSKIYFQYKDTNNLFVIYEYIHQLAQNMNKEETTVRYDFEWGVSSPLDNQLGVLQEENITEDMLTSPIKIFVGKSICDINMDNLIEVVVDINEEQILTWALSMTNLQKNKVEWLCENSNYNCFRINNELKKLECDNAEERFNQLNNSNNYIDLGEFDFNPLIKSILKKENIELKVQMQDNYEFLSIEDILRFIEELHNEYVKILQINKINPTKEEIKSNGLTIKEFKYYKDIICDLYEEKEIAKRILKLNELKINILIHHNKLFKDMKDYLQYIIFMVK